MSFGSSTDTLTVPGLSIKKFVTQDEVDEKKKKRQEEWEKVRKPEDPEECPEEPVDNRCLYDKLEEQRLKKQEEIDEQAAFKNQVKRLDEGEVQFLDFVAERQQEISRKKTREEAEIISELKSAQVVKLAESKLEEKKAKPVQQTSTKRSQSSLLSGAVRKKRSEETSPTNKKPRLSDTTDESQELQKEENNVDNVEKTKSETDKQQSNSAISDTTQGGLTESSSGSNVVRSVGKVVAILPSVLPGMNQYEDSTDSQSSSSDSEPEFHIARVCGNKVPQSH